MKILVTGGAGFIGTHVVNRLVERGDECVVLDNLTSGDAGPLPRGVLVLERDITVTPADALFAGIRPQVVVHAAAQVSVSASMADPVRDRVVNVEGTSNVLRAALAAGVQRFVFVSSGGAVYGEGLSQAEDATPRPHSFYGIHKLAAEGYVRMAGLPWAIARPSNVYGPGQRGGLEGGAVVIFSEAVTTGTPVTVHGDGGQRRDFVYVADVVEAIVAMIDSRMENVWNVGSGTSVTVNELLRTVERAASRRATRLEAPARTGDVRDSGLAIDRIRRDLGWEPRVGLEEGVRLVVNAVQSQTGRR